MNTQPPNVPDRKPDGWGVFALVAPGVYALQQVTHGDRDDAERAASRFIRGCDAHVRPLYAGPRV